jgi:hypothetical protein
MWGGAGHDIFVVWGSSTVSDNRIMDFAPGDKLGVNFNAFGVLASGSGLSSLSYQSGTSNQAGAGSGEFGSPLFIFRTTDGTLWFDPDGQSSIYASFKVMKLNVHSLSTSDFIDYII